MLLNSKFNCIYALINLFELINLCIMNDTIFCSNIIDTTFSIYFKIIIIGYLAPGIKVCSNITYIFMAINRYMLIGKDHLKVLEKLSEFKSKYVLKVSIIFGLK